MNCAVSSRQFALLALLVAVVAPPIFAEAIPVAGAVAPTLRGAIEEAVDAVRPGLVRIHVVETYYSEGREMKYEASGSGVVISAEGHVVTNHHVAGHAKQIKCTFANKEEIEAELVGTDPLTDIAVLKLKPQEERTFATVDFGDSDAVQVGDHVLAMGSPLALSQSVTLGIISNTEMIMPNWMNRWGGMEMDGEDVGALVRWFGHDADIYGGNSGGPLVDLSGRIIGINEIKMGLSGAIPGNLARSVARELIDRGRVRRAWIGLEVQPRLKHGDHDKGVLVSGVIDGSPAAEVGLEPGDHILKVGETMVDVQFAEQIPAFNLLITELAIGEPIPLSVLRSGKTETIDITPSEREPLEPDEYEIKPWGLTVRDLSYMLAKEMKRSSKDGVLVTSVRPGGGAGSAKPEINNKDVIVAVQGKPVKNVEDLQAITREITEGAVEPVPVLTRFERKDAEFVTVVEIGIDELQDPGLEVKKAWLPVKTQVITRDIAELLGDPELTGFRVTHVFKNSTAEKAGLQVGDLILAVDGQSMTASAPEHYEELETYIRQYREGTEAELTIQRDGAEQKLAVELVRAPKLAREMKKYRDDNFEFTVRDITFFDRAAEQWAEQQHGVYVDEVKSGGWAALGNLGVGDLLLAIDGQPVNSVEDVQARMEIIEKEHPKAVVFKVLRNIYTHFIELEPKWDTQ